MLNIKNFPSELYETTNAALINGILRGVEREALRVDEVGHLAKTKHPPSLGSALTHPYITTDFSEALLEFITPPTHCVSELFNQLENIHRFVGANLGEEKLWTASMPCALPANESDIPVARYGRSHNGHMKTIYRLGLGHRYGRSMQTVAGIHYNFSLPNAFWAHFHTKENSLLSLEAYKDKRYFSLIRNFRRHFWLLILLFGASPAMCRSFVGDRPHDLEALEHNLALYRPYATSLRMGDLGYQSHAQESLFICYNEKASYIKTLTNAILEPHSLYRDIPLLDASGEYQQLNQGLLQIENEFYSAIRPKRSAKPGETALTALHRRGVEYIEVRCLDIDPFTPLGITKEQVAFIDVFLLTCALAESPESDQDEFKYILQNQKRVVNDGRRPELKLVHSDHGEISVTEWAKALFAAMQPVAELLDRAYGSEAYSYTLTNQLTRIEDLSQTPSALILQELKQKNTSYSSFSTALVNRNNAILRADPVDEEMHSRFVAMAEKSLVEQTQLEAQSTGSFEQFLKAYYKQYEALR